MSYSLNDLRTIPDDELIKQHDAMAQHTSVGVQYFLDELARRDAVKLAQETQAATNEMRMLTRVITGLTALNVIVVVVSLIHA